MRAGRGNSRGGWHDHGHRAGSDHASRVRRNADPGRPVRPEVHDCRCVVSEADRDVAAEQRRARRRLRGSADIDSVRSDRHAHEWGTPCRTARRQDQLAVDVHIDAASLSSLRARHTAQCNGRRARRGRSPCPAEHEGQCCSKHRAGNWLSPRSPLRGGPSEGTRCSLHDTSLSQRSSRAELMKLSRPSPPVATPTAKTKTR